MNLPIFLLLTTCVSLTPAIAADAEKLDPAAVDFFENKIRPVLAEHCYECHSQKSEKVKGGLSIDTREGLVKGGDSGPALVPGDPEKSLLIKAVRYTDEHLQMPPKNKKLSTEQIAALEEWVKMGAPDPRTGKSPEAAAREEQLRNHWAFKPIANPPLPAIQSEFVENPVDLFVQARLQEAGFKPSPKADRRTLIRRAYFDLLGLPPTPEEVDAFANDRSENAYANLVDRLLASPQYGERWARHWLDVARYADTKGYVFEEERRYPFAYTYRDYVIRALNEDLPFDRFILEQLAADQLDLGEDKRPLAAMGFLTLGRRFLNNQHDIIDDRIDVVTRGLMGLTVQCARCHDHKYDPIPIQDYYSLYGVFSNSTEPREKPLLGNKSLPKEYPAYLEEKKKREDELANFRKEKDGEVLAQLRSRASEYMLAASDTEKLEDKSKSDNLAKERKLDPGVVRRWMKYLEDKRKNTNDALFAPWFAFASLAPAELASASPTLAAKFQANETSTPLNPLVAKLFQGEPPKNLEEVASRYKRLFDEVDAAWTNARKEKSDLEKLPDSDQENIRLVLYAPDSPANLSSGELPRLYDVPSIQKNRALIRKVEELDAIHPGAPPRGMVMEDVGNPRNPHVFVRGNPRNQGPEVPRQFLELIAGPSRKPFQKGSGRLEMAQAIASKDNPLTSRVIVNRVWLHHFGAGLVRTPSDFGVRSDPPSHPELLDYLANSFMENGWSLKKLHRLIMLSHTYQQGSDDNPEYSQKDPNNALLWKMNRRRLEFEPFRDALLAISGKLDSEQGGLPVQITTYPFTTRRSIYSFIERQNLPGMFRTFDFASPDTTSPQRFNTTVPQQALFMINSPFVADQARALARRAEINGESSTRRKIVALYRAAIQREPTPEESDLAQKFIDQQNALPLPEPPIEVWQYGYGRLDPATRAVSIFLKLPHFTGSAWQGGEKLPDPNLGYLTLSATRGHPGDGMDNVVIRRWTAPRDAVVSISGALAHENTNGDGVRGHIISSRHGELGFWPVYNSKQEMNIPRIPVQRGDFIDFVVDSGSSLDSDTFSWAPVIKTLNSGGSDEPATWRAKEDFSGPKEVPTPLDPWEKLAQVLLMSNELAFVD